jgi:hypothetical protein
MEKQYLFVSYARTDADRVLLAPYASSICHSKSGIAENGKFYSDDFASMKVMRDTGFRGVYSLEFEGVGDPVDGVRKLMDPTLEYLD